MTMTLKAARVNAGLSVRDVASIMQVDPSTINNWERGKSFPSIVKYEKLCELYGCTKNDIFFTRSVRWSAKE